MPRKFDYRKAEDDLYNSGCRYSEEIYAYRSEESIDKFLKENGLDPEKYYEKPAGASPDKPAVPHGPDSGCYLTTACITAKGLPDDCEELTVLREYRDTYLIKREGGAKDIARYYKTAPEIVKSIDALPCSEQIWLDLYETLVRPCVERIKQGKTEEVYEKYKSITLELEQKYLRAGADASKPPVNGCTPLQAIKA